VLACLKDGQENCREDPGSPLHGLDCAAGSEPPAAGWCRPAL